MTDPLDSLAALGDPVRRRTYEFVVAAAEAVGRDEVAQGLGIGRTLAAFHLDKLVAAGLLEASYARRSGRTGPGAGRPAKLYRRSTVEHTVSLPPRAYDQAAHIMAEALDQVGADVALYALARARGAKAGAALTRQRDVLGALAERGYEPAVEPGGRVIRLRNCPFHTVADEFPPLVCGMNLALLEGFVAGAQWTTWTATLQPSPGHCCVILTKIKGH